MIYNRAERADFGNGAQRSSRGWGYVDLLPHFKRTERRIGIADDRIHGRTGKLPVTDIDWIHPVCEAFIAGAVGVGIPRCEDYNSGDHPEGLGCFQRALYRGYHHSEARVFLHPARATRRLDARAAQFLFDGTRAVGVRYVDDRDRTAWRQVHARREVIASRGTANIAKPLQLSGVGPTWLLQSPGVEVRADLPVGENCRDHYAARMVARLKNVRTINEMSHAMGLAGRITRWMLGRPSILSLRRSLVHWASKSEDGSDFPDLQGVFSPASLKQGMVGLLDDFPGMTCGVWQNRGKAAAMAERGRPTRSRIRSFSRMICPIRSTSACRWPG